MTATNLECVQRHSWAKQTATEMKFVCFPVGVRECHRFQVEVFKSRQAVQLGHLGVKAAAAQFAITLLDGAHTHDLEAWYACLTSDATNLFDLLYLGSFHLALSIAGLGSRRAPVHALRGELHGEPSVPAMQRLKSTESDRGLFITHWYCWQAWTSTASLRRGARVTDHIHVLGGAAGTHH